MKILFVCHRFPYPPRDGAKLRAFHIIKHLARNHQVTLASPVRSIEEAQAAPGVAAYCERYVTARVHEAVQALRMIALLPTTTPSSMGYFHSARLAKKVDELLLRERFDLIFVLCSSVAHYVAKARGAPKIIDFVDMDSRKWLDYVRFKPFPLAAGYWLEGRKLERAERQIARGFDVCTTVTRAEWETLESYRTGAITDWFPNGVDAQYFHPENRDYDPDTLCFVGRMNYYPNEEAMTEFCAKVLPRIQARRPSTKLVIVGAEPTAAVRKLAERPGVSVTGAVPDVRPHLWRSAAAVTPLNIARGTQNKILEAMACGVPVVSSLTAAAGVDAAAPDHILAAASADEYAACVLSVLEDRAERARLAAACRARVLERHDWGASMRRLDGILERCFASFGRPKAAA